MPRMTRVEREALMERAHALGLHYIAHPGGHEPNRWVFPDHVARGDFQALRYVEQLERERGSVDTDIRATTAGDHVQA